MGHLAQSNTRHRIRVSDDAAYMSVGQVSEYFGGVSNMWIVRRLADSDFPNMITVYRGCGERFVNGVSWTTDLKTKSSPDLFYVNPGESEIVCSSKIKRVEKADLDRIMGAETINGEPDFRS